MSFSRTEFKRNGVYFIEMQQRFHWKDSYVTDAVARFNGPSPILCTQCSMYISPEELYFKGRRQVCVDAPIDITGVDFVHGKCYDDEFDETTYVRQNSAAVERFGGFFTLSKDRKLKLLEIAGREKETDLLNKELALQGMAVWFCGKFGWNKSALEEKIQANGGRVCQESYGATHILLGASGRTRWGQPIGRGSKKFKEASKWARAVDAAYIDGAIKQFEQGVRWQVDHNEYQEAKAEEAAKAKALRDEKRKANAAKRAARQAELAKLPKRATRSRAKRGGTDPDSPSTTKRQKTEEKEEQDVIPLAELDIDSLSRKKLQALCKANGLKASGKNDELKDRVRAFAQSQ